MGDVSFTPGPWSYTEGEYPCLYLGDGGDPLDGSDLGVGVAQATANARLIAAAPDLYEALAGWDNLHCAMVAAGGDKGCLPDGLIDQFGQRQVALMQSTTAALAKARGESVA